MLKSHEKFHSAHGKRLILVADDEQINRELLGMVLGDDYEIIYAADGQETLDQAERHQDELSLVLLDLMMPVKSGLTALKELKADERLRKIPVIVLTADQNSEVESLTLGAIDYIPKPYPQPGIILARILRAIELSEDREIIQSTERDALTGLYNREYFYRYAEQYDQHHRDLEMDAIVVDINHFHIINERFGTAYGDGLLRLIGDRLREAVGDADGIVCRRSADTFMIYCPHGLDYRAILDSAAAGLEEDESVSNRVRLRMGIYADVDKELEIERRFDRAKMAADKVRNSFTKTIGVYDSTMHERELYAEQLIDDFHTAIEEQQFQVYYQPKFDVRPKSPVLGSAEALVRWQHPTLGMISPGVFIPLFEENGLVQELDNYIWRQTAAQIRDWKERLGFSVPISINVSRIDMYDPNLLAHFDGLLQDYGLRPEELLLEITESAYTEDADQIIETVNALRDMGFRIEMDDFGTGYSSLNMISTLPIDALKLDMQFVRSAFQEQKDTRMLEVIIDIAKHLNVPVIAEGVETEEQLNALRDLGCDIVQGYYFSRPVPASAFEPFLEIRKTLEPEELLPEKEAGEEKPVQEAAAPKREKHAIHLRATNYIFVILALVLAAALAFTDVLINRSHIAMDEANSRFISATKAADDLEAGSDYLTVSVRSFVVTGDLNSLDDYFREINVTQRREKSVVRLEELIRDSDSETHAILSDGLSVSNGLKEHEYRAMRLTQLANEIPDSSVPEEISSFPLSPEELVMPAEDKQAKAVKLVFGSDYLDAKELIRGYVVQCTEHLITTSEQERASIRTSMDRLMLIQGFLLGALVLAVLADVIFITTQIRIPLSRMVQLVRMHDQVPPAGAEELRFVTRTYNEILEENRRARTQLSYEASHDQLTGLMNRSAYENFMDRADRDHIALLIIDVDNFKTVNDTYGHDVGDRILKKVADILTGSFRSVDAVCRLGGDEFVVVMTRANSSMQQLVLNKINRANELLQQPKDGLPRASLSVGVAFSDRKNPEGDIFKDADTALYEVKRGGRCGCVIYGTEGKR